jgi:hypothetical protein
MWEQHVQVLLPNARRPSWNVSDGGTAFACVGGLVQYYTAFVLLVSKSGSRSMIDGTLRFQLEPLSH